MAEEPTTVEEALPAPGTWKLRDGMVGVALLVAWIGSCYLGRRLFALVPSGVTLLFVVIVMVVLLVVYPLWIARRRGVRVAIALPRPRRLLVEGGVAILVVMAFYLVAGTVLQAIRIAFPQFTPPPSIWQSAAETPHAGLLLAILVFAVTVAPVCEEVFFRWFLYNTLRARMPAVAAGAIQCVLFAALHYYYTGFYVFQIFIFGIALTLVYAWRKTLVAPILTHGCLNLVSSIVLVGLMVAAAKAPGLGVVGDMERPGVHVKEVLPGSAAEKAGILPGDEIIAVNGQPVADFQALKARLRSHKIGDSILLQVVRGEDVTDVPLVLEKLPRIPSP